MTYELQVDTQKWRLIEVTGVHMVAFFQIFFLYSKIHFSTKNEFHKIRIISYITLVTHILLSGSPNYKF
mgnify:CR=1 FL=1